MAKNNHVEILKKRAKRIAKPITDRALLEENLIEILVFQLENEKYAFETKYINEVYPLKEFTHLPGAPKFIYGITNVRRKILSIINLKVLFGLSNDYSEKTPKKLVLLGDDEKEMAILIDNFHGITTVINNDIQTTLPTLTGVRQEYLKGILLDGTVILDAKKILNSKQLLVDQSIEI